MAENRELKIIINADSGDAQKKLGGLSTAVFKAQVAFEAIRRGVGAAKDAIGDSVKASEQYRQALVALGAVAAGFGLDQKEANKAALLLARDGLLTVSEAALGLRNLFSSGLDIQTSVALMQTLKDSASANRKTYMSLADQVVTTTEGIKNQNSVLTDNSGISTNYNRIVQNTADRLGVQQSALDDVSKAYAVANGFIREGAIYSGFAARESSTLSGKQSILTSNMTKFKTLIGQALTPALLDLADTLGNQLSDAIVFLQRNMLFLQRAFVLLATIGKSAINILTLQFEEAKKSARGYWSYVESQSKESADEQLSTVKELNEKIEEVNTSSAQKITEAIGDENKRFQRQMEDRARSFKENMLDMLSAHQEKADEIKSQLKDEKEKFQEDNADRERDYKHYVADITRSHKKKVEDIKRDLEEELSKGEEVNRDRVADIKRRLKEENDEFAYTLEERKRKYEEETMKAKSEYAKRKSELEVELNEERAILEKHKDKRGAIMERMKESDIERLERQYKEEKALFKEQHLERLEQVRREGAQSGAAMGAAFKDALKKETEEAARQVEEQLDKIAGIPERKGFLNKAQDAFAGVFQEPVLFLKGVKIALENFLRSAAPLSRGGGGGGGEAGDFIARPGQPIQKFSSADTVVGFKQGGPIAGMMGGVTINFNGDMSVRSDNDITSLAQEISRVLGRQAEFARIGVGA